MMAHEYTLVLWVAFGLIVIVMLIGLFRLPPFLGILIGALFSGWGMGVPVENLLPAFAKGAGQIMGQTGLIIAAGAMLGGILAESGAAVRIASSLLNNTRPRYLSWMIALCAMIIGLPLFFEVGLVMMLPMIIALSRHSNLPFVRISVPALAGMTTLHALVPPHPGPLIAINELHANLGLTMILGITVAIPTVIISGPLYSYWLASRQSEIGKEFSTPLTPVSMSAQGLQPSLLLSISTILLPVFLMMMHSYIPLLFGSSPEFLTFIGQPLPALVIAVIFAASTLRQYPKWSIRETGEILQKYLPPVAALILTIGAGGGLKKILLDADISQAISQIAEHFHITLVLLAWFIAVAIRQATGSATVATTTASGIIASMAGQVSSIQDALLVLVIGSGSVFFCHINDAGFWMVKSFFKLEFKQTLWMWSVLQTLVSLSGLILCTLIWKFT